MTDAATPPPTKIGFVGLGNMGLPMCLNLLKDRDVASSIVAYDTNETALSKAELAGAAPAGSVVEIAEGGCDLVFTMLPGCDSVESVMMTMLESTLEGHDCVFVDCSTVSPMVSRTLHDRVSSHGGLSMIDAPVSGGVRGAEDGTLTFMVGSSSKTALDAARPHFDKMGRAVMECGGPGNGSAAKLCNNLALAAQMIGVCEAMNLGDELGVDPIVLAGVINASTGRCWSSEVNNPHPDVATAKMEGGGPATPASRNYDGGFGTKLMLKDLGLAIRAGEDVGVALPLGTASKELYKLAELRGLGEKDFGVILQFLRGK